MDDSQQPKPQDQKPRRRVKKLTLQPPGSRWTDSRGVKYWTDANGTVHRASPQLVQALASSVIRAGRGAGKDRSFTP